MQTFCTLAVTRLSHFMIKCYVNAFFMKKPHLLSMSQNIFADPCKIRSWYGTFREFFATPCAQRKLRLIAVFLQYRYNCISKNYFSVPLKNVKFFTSIPLNTQILCANMIKVTNDEIIMRNEGQIWKKNCSLSFKNLLNVAENYFMV